MIRKIRNNFVIQFLKNLILILIYSILILVLILVIVQKCSSNTQGILGYRIFRVESGSMLPKYKIGDVLLVKEVEQPEIKIGNDLVYRDNMDNKIITHQIIDIQNNTYITKGLANNLEDEPIEYSQIIGIVKSKLILLSFLNKPYVIYIIITTLITLTLIKEIQKLILDLKKGYNLNEK